MNKDYVLKIDFREKDLVNYFDSCQEVNYTKDSLDLGDIVFEHVGGDVLIVIERKKIPDLSNSIYDGRYKEQKKRMKDALHKNVRKVYLIEGNDLRGTKLNMKTFIGVKINTMMRDNIHVVHVDKFEQTVTFIKNVYSRLEKYAKDMHKEVATDEGGDSCYSAVCTINKKKNLTPDVYKIIQFQQIPSVSNVVAKLIVENIGSLANIYKKYVDEDSKKQLIKDISELKYGEKMRRVGPKTAEKIVTYIF